MNKAERYAKIVKSQKTTLRNRIYYFFLLRKLKKSAKQHYDGHNFYGTTFNPYILNRLEKDGFEVKKKKKKKYIQVNWTYSRNQIDEQP